MNVTIGEQGRVLARYADSMGFKRAGILYRNEPSGKDFVTAFSEEFAKHGGSVIEHDPFTEDIWDYDAYAKRLVKNGAQVVAVAGNSPQSRAAIRALRMAGGQQPVLSTNGPAAKDTGDFRGLHHIVLYSPDRPVAAGGRDVRDAVPGAVPRERRPLVGARLRCRHARSAARCTTSDRVARRSTSGSGRSASRARPTPA